jgi:radical SAM family uncharacterized protein/radical SAM-linked protein
MNNGGGRHPYADFLGDVEKPSRYVGGEYQQVVKPAGEVQARVCLAFPDVYEIGMSHLGTKILYSVLNKTAGVACERAFSPWMDMEGELRRRDLPLLTLESASPLADFDVLGMSLQYELTYSNVLALLDLSRIPLRAAERGDQHPLILCGGPTATHPEPLAPFIDAFFIGEAEEALPALCLEVAALRRAGVPRRERLCRLAEKYPLYVPELYATLRDPETGFVVVGAPLDPRVPARPRRAWVADINRYPFPDDSPLPYAEAIFDRMAVEVARGCTEGCRFCQAGMIYRPVRERDPVAVIDSLVEGVRKGGYDETSLTSLSTADYSCVTPLVKAAMAKLRDEKVSLSVSSLRAYGLNEDLLADMATMKAQGLTFAPEAGTQRMRDVITKNVTEADITESAHRVFARGFQRMKLYFMIGLPTEEDVDVRGIVETTGRVQEIGRRYYRAAQVTASVSTHVPKPHTPFQWAAMDTEEETARKQQLLAETARAARVSLKMHENHQSHLEGIFSRGDRSCADVLERAFHLGCRFDGWDEAFRLDLWDQAIEEQRARTGWDPGKFLGTIPVTARLPWDHLEMGLEPDFLAKEYRKALKDRLSPPCGKPYKQLLHHTNVADAEGGRKQKLVCYDCGVACDLDAMKEERLYFLRRMNAWTPPAAVQAPARRGADAVGAARGARQPATRLAQPQGPGRRYRLRYTKLGRIAYLGHLDLIRHLPRIFRRAGIELFYSSGFHPKPELSFGPALGLGIPSLGELLDVTLVDAPDPRELMSRLNEVTLDGIQFLGATALGDDDRALGRVLACASYAALLPPPAALVSTALVTWSEGTPLSVVRGAERGKIGRTVDVRRGVTAVVAADEMVAAALGRHFGWPAERVITFGVRVSAEGSARPAEVVEALVGAEPAARAELVRLELSAAGEDEAAGAGGRLDPLDTGALRAAAHRARAARVAAAGAGAAAASDA